MSTRRTLLQRISSRTSLLAAWENLKKNSSSQGLSGETIQDFSQNLKQNLATIQHQLKSANYQFSRLRGVAIAKSGLGQFRPIRIPEVRDRVVLRAIANAIQPLLNKRLELSNDASYAYQEGLGPRMAIERVVDLYQQGRPVVLEADIERFFDSVDRDALLSQSIYPNLPDDSLNNLIERGVRSQIGNRDCLTEAEWTAFAESEAGIPQGNALSPLLSNVYLAPFDRAMIAAGHGLVRYADDFVVLSTNPEQALEAYELAGRILEAKLRLRLHPLDDQNPKSKTRIVRLTQKSIEFLSICFNGRRLWPAKRKVTELKTKLRAVTQPNRHTNVLSIVTKSKNLLSGWIGAFYYTDIEPFFEEIDSLANLQLAGALYRIGWQLDRKSLICRDGRYYLSPEQRRRSGIPFCHEILKPIRERNGMIELD